MTVVFDKNNLKEVINKKPLILYYSENGACGPSGLFFVIFQDKSCYGYSTFYEKSNKTLIHSIIEHVPEFKFIMTNDKDMNYKREHFNTYSDVYLGLGNWSLIDESLLDEFHSYEEGYIINSFKKLVIAHTDQSVLEISDMVRKAIYENH